MNLNDPELKSAFQIGMGTEHSADILEVLVQMLRPTQLLEIGAGYTTLSILSGLASARDEQSRDSEIVKGNVLNAERQSLIKPGAAWNTYSPHLTVFENFSVQPSSADKVASLAKKKGWESMLTFINADFFSDSYASLASLPAPLDFVWLDAGNPIEDIQFINTIAPHLADDSWIVMHEPFICLPVQLSDGSQAIHDVPTPVVNELLRRSSIGDGETQVEFVIVPESHKVRQAGLLIVHRRTSNYTINPTFDSLAAEVDELERVLNLQISGAESRQLRLW